MKKFLFTLAAMFMVTSAFAASYLYIDANDFTVTKADIENGTEITIPVRAHFFARVSGWDFEITNLPAGMTFTYAEKGASFDVTTKNARGRDQVISATLYGAEAPYLHMLAVQGEVGYWQDPNGENPTAWVSYGVTKWEGGDYDEMLLMYAVFDSTYHGGKIESVTAVSSGRDSRGNTVTDYPGEQSTFWPNPEEGSVFPDPDPTTQEPVDVAAPTHDITMDAENVYVTITWPETTGNHVYTGLEVYPRPAYGEEAESYDVEAYTEADYPYNESAHDAFTVNVPAKELVPELSSEPIITFVETTEDGKVVAVEVVVENYDSYQIYVNDELLRGTVINASTEEAKVIRVVATNDDDDEAPAYLPNTIERTYTLAKLEQEELEKTDAPSIAANAHMGNIYDEDGNLVEEHHGYYQVVVTETEAGSDLEYRVKFNDGEWSDWMPYSEAVNFDVEGNYVVEARAKVDGKDYSDPVTVSFSVTATTGLELLNGEKAVAGVRYFNVAGQEMQEANGVTIVVTTYTDGSVTAVKVMK